MAALRRFPEGAVKAVILAAAVTGSPLPAGPCFRLEGLAAVVAANGFRRYFHPGSSMHRHGPSGGSHFRMDERVATMSGFSGRWTNQLGSEMNITVTGQSVTGTYQSAVGNVVSGKKYNLVGFVSEDIIGFVVDYDDSVAVATWIGRYVSTEGVERIHTLWHTGSTYADKSHTKKRDLWDSFGTNADVFDRAP